MHYIHTILGGRVRAAILGSGASLLLAGAMLALPALAADQSPAAVQTPETIGPHTHQLHGTIKTAASGSSTTFTLTTERYGDVTVSFEGATPRGHGHGHSQGQGHARSHEVATATGVTVGERVVVLGRTSIDGKTFVARRLHALPAQGEDGSGQTNHVVATITGVTATNGVTTLTVQLADGTSQTVTLATDAKIRPQGKTTADLKTGTHVTVVTRAGVATGVVIMP